MKNSTKKVLTAALAATIAISGSMSAFAATPQEITAKNPTSYTAGIQSVYGPNLNQDQLSAVAQAAADFKTNHVTDNMTNDQKIQTAHDFLKNTVSYIDWDQGEGANTAYGALVKGQAACSGYARAFKALCDAVDVSCYYIHADAAAGNPSHQWNIVEYNDGYYFVDVQTNDSSGFNAIYHSSTHPYTCDMSQLPAIGSKSGQNTAGTQATVTEGWKQDNTGWWYQNADGSYPMNAWREISGKQYYFGGNGYMLANTTTPDGYMVGSDGAWVQGQQSANDGVHTKTFNDADARVVNDVNPLQYRTDTNGNDYRIIPETTTSFKLLSEDSNVDPEKMKIIFTAYKYNPETNTIYVFSNDGDAIYENFKYDETYDLKIPNVNLRGADLVNYCKQNNIMIRIDVNDKDDAMGARFLYCYK